MSDSEMYAVIEQRNTLLEENAALRERVEELTERRDAYYTSYKKAMERVGELEAIVEKLPKTADGVPITPGMKVWGTSPFGGVRDPATAQLRGFFDEYPIFACEWGHNVAGRECYSTREAALAASKKEATNDTVG